VIIGTELFGFTVVPLLVCAAFALCAPANEPATMPTAAMAIAILRMSNPCSPFSSGEMLGLSLRGSLSMMRLIEPFRNFA
jgi:hypothetical protein